MSPKSKSLPEAELSDSDKLTQISWQLQSLDSRVSNSNDASTIIAAMVAVIMLAQCTWPSQKSVEFDPEVSKCMKVPWEEKWVLMTNVGTPIVLDGKSIRCDLKK